MAYGMLTSFALGAAQGLGTAMINKYSKDQDAEIKAKADAEREARIEEAAIRSEGRLSIREDLKYNKMRTDTLADKESQAAQDYINKATEHEYRVEDFNTQERLRQQDDIAKEKREAIRRNDPTDIDYKLKNQQLETSKAAELNSNTLKTTQEINQKVAQMELDRKTQILDLQKKIQTTTDENEANKLKSKLIWLEGKSDEPSIQKMSIDTGRIDPTTRKPIEQDILVKVDKITGKWETLDVAGRLKEGKPFTKEEAIAVAKAEADADPKIGVRNSTWFDTKGDKDNTSQYDDYVNKRVVELTNTPRGMLNSKSEGKTSDKVTAPNIGEVEVGKVSNTESLIKVTNPVEQKQLDNLFNVIKVGESGGKGVNAGTPKPTADDPNPTASGTFQVIDDNLKSHGIKPELPNGKYSAAQKDAFAPTFYKEVYEKTGGNQAAIVAAGFGQEDVYQAMVKAKAKGSNSWWDYLNPEGGVEKNMPIIKNRIKQQQQYLIKNDIPVPVSISDFRLNNK
jgi:hypothetical protein